MSITSEDIKQHIINLVNNENESFADRDLMNEYKKSILNNANEISNNQGLDYIAEMIINDMNRNLLNIEKSNFDIMKINLTNLVEYLECNLNNVFNEYIYKYLVEAVEDKIYTSFGFSENINKIVEINGLISAIVRNLHICDLVKKAEKMNIAKKRDSKKIKNAIDTLLLYTNDEQIKHYLKTINLPTRDITVSTILSCIFCDIYKICEEIFLNELNKSKILDLTKNIMENVFSCTIDYRPYPDVEIIKYKGYKLRMFKVTKKKSN